MTWTGGERLGCGRGPSSTLVAVPRAVEALAVGPCRERMSLSLAGISFDMLFLNGTVLRTALVRNTEVSHVTDRVTRCGGPVRVV